jgi:hypothetical protein
MVGLPADRGATAEFQEHERLTVQRSKAVVKTSSIIKLCCRGPLLSLDLLDGFFQRDRLLAAPTALG